MTTVMIIHLVLKFPSSFLLLQLTADRWSDNMTTVTNKGFWASKKNLKRLEKQKIGGGGGGVENYLFREFGLVNSTMQTISKNQNQNY
jgi:hypothetical protein